MLFKSATVLIATVLLSDVATAKIVADCGASIGKAYYSDPRSNRWQDDQTSGGRILIDTISDTSATVIIRNAMGQTSDVRDSGGKPIVIGRNENWTEFTIVVTYPGGTVETYLLTNKGGFRVLLSTVSRHAAGPVPPKVSAYVARCETP